MGTAISFPALGIDLGIVNPVAFTALGRPVMWYGVIIATAFLLAAIYVMRRAPAFGLNDDLIIDMLIFATPAAIVSARLYYVIFNFSLFRDNPARIIRIWEGGIAIYGAVIGAAITVLVFCRIRKVNPAAMLDIGALGLLIGQCIGRFGNFINAEAYGTVTGLPWGMSLGGSAPVHPTFLYESLWTLAGFLLLHFYSKRRRYHGQIFLMYITWYGFGRGLIEGLRIDSLYFFDTGLRVSQILGFASFIIGALLLLYHRIFVRHDPATELSGLAYVPKEQDMPAVPSEEPVPAGADSEPGSTTEPETGRENPVSE